MIILTGASGGIGQSVIPFLTEIDDVIGIYNHNKPTSAENTCTEYIQLDLLDSIAIAAFVKNNKNKLKNITVVHGAAMKLDELMVKYDENEWDKVIDVNLKSNFLLTKAMLPLMIEQNWGRIINITSTGATRGAQGTIAYSTSKSGLTGMTRVLATEYARFNITANLLSLGYFKCGLYENLNDKIRNKLINEIPSKKLGDVENISYAINFLMKSDFTNGAIINIDGGI